MYVLIGKGGTGSLRNSNQDGIEWTAGNKSLRAARQCSISPYVTPLALGRKLRLGMMTRLIPTLVVINESRVIG